MDKIKTFITKFTNGEIIPIDKFLHFSFSFIIASFFLNPFVVLGVVFAVNFGKELFDKYVKKTKFDIWDLVAGLAGATFYLLKNYLS